MKMDNWAVVGASNKENKFGYKIVNELKDNGYQVFPVNPKYEQVAGLDCYSNIEEISKKIDVVDFVVNPEIGQKIIKNVAELEINYVWLQPGSRSEVIKEYADNNGIKVIESCIYAQLKKQN